MKFKAPIEVQAGISDGDPTNPLGQSGYLLSSDGSNVNWVSPGGLSAATAETIVQPIKANEALSKGDPLYIVGYQTGQNVNIVAKADSSDVAKMPVVGLADDDYANQAFGTMTAFGSFNGDFDTTGGTESWAVGDIIFVKPGGGLTNIKPGGTDLIQNVAIVSRVNSQTGELEVIALGRTNDVPNLPTGRLFVGTATNTSLVSDVVYVDEPNNRVGIGTDTPGSLLHIKGADPILTIQDTSTGTANASSTLRLGESGSGGVLDVYWDIKQASDVLDTHLEINHSSNGNHFTILDNGNVGIGTASPSQKLDVIGNVTANRYYGTGSTTYYVDPNDTSQAAYFAGDIRITDSGTATIKLDSTNTYPGASIVATKNGSTSPPMGDISWVENPGFQGSTWSQRLTNVPYTESSIKLPTSSSYNFAIKTLGSDRMVINSSGNVGIGTTSPSRALEINTTGSNNYQFRIGTDAYYYDIGRSTSNGFLNFYGNQSNASGFVFETVNGERMRIGSAGQIGIGGANYGTPGQVLTSNGSATGPTWQTPTLGDITGVTAGDYLNGGGTSGNVTLNIDVGASGDWWDKGVAVRSDGVMEVGKYIDFHEADAGTTDNDFRITSSGGRLYFSGDIEVDGGDIYINDSNTRITEGGNNSVRIQTSSGYVDIGPNNSSYSHFYTDRGQYYFNKGLTVDTGQVRSYNEDLDLNRAGSTTARLRITSGTTISDQALQSASTVRSQFDSGDYAQLESNSSGGVIKAVSATSTKVLFRSYGDSYILNDLGIGTSSPSARLHVESTTSTTSSGIVRLKSLTASNGPYIRIIDFIRSNNSLRGYIALNPYAVQYSTSSDYRLKRNVTPMENSIDRIKLLKPSRFNWVEGPDDYVVDGFIAHEVQDVVHDAVSGEKDAVDENNEPAYQGIDQSKLVPLLTAALQDAITKIEQLETRIQTLENN